MKRQTNTLLFTTLGNEAIEKLTSIVAEVVADTTHQSNNSKIFSVADLWNIQKQRRSFVQRRFY